MVLDWSYVKYVINYIGKIVHRVIHMFYISQIKLFTCFILNQSEECAPHQWKWSFGRMSPVCYCLGSWGTVYNICGSNSWFEPSSQLKLGQPNGSGFRLAFILSSTVLIDNCINWALFFFFFLGFLVGNKHDSNPQSQSRNAEYTTMLRALLKWPMFEFLLTQQPNSKWMDSNWTNIWRSTNKNLFY